MEDANLTLKQHRFVSAYAGAAMGNATAAAELAGYSGDRATLQAIGSENLSKPMISGAIRTRLEQFGMEHDEVLERLSAMALASVLDVLQRDPETGKWTFDLDYAREQGAEQTIRELTIRPDGTIEIRMHDAQKALIEILRYYDRMRRHDALQSGEAQIRAETALQRFGLVVLSHAEPT